MSATAQGKNRRYVLISPVRDEEKYLEKTIRSMAQQTVRPIQWIIVNDGSTDRTPEIIERWAAKEPWILPVHRADDGHLEIGTPSASQQGNRGNRARRAKEMEAFYEGYQRLVETEWEFVAKLDGDLGFEPEYFEKCFAHFDADASLGIGGGVICHLHNGELQVEQNPRFHVRGATKIYRRACWEDIAGAICAPGWDTVDEVKANMLGWTTRSFEDLRVVHYRFTGAANGGWQNAIKNGLWNYIAGYHPLFMLVKCIKRLLEKPYAIGSIGLLCGFLGGYIRGVPQIDDKALVHYLRTQQLRRLSFRSTIWR
jgi:poly-beta-1,6-N-acetyl-D-glucosamine synthase